MALHALSQRNPRRLLVALSAQRARPESTTRRGSRAPAPTRLAPPPTHAHRPPHAGANARGRQSRTRWAQAATHRRPVPRARPGQWRRPDRRTPSANGPRACRCADRVAHPTPPGVSPGRLRSRRARARHRHAAASASRHGGSAPRPQPRAWPPPERRAERAARESEPGAPAGLWGRAPTRPRPHRGRRSGRPRRRSRACVRAVPPPTHSMPVRGRAIAPPWRVRRPARPPRGSAGRPTPPHRRAGDRPGARGAPRRSPTPPWPTETDVQTP